MRYLKIIILFVLSMNLLNLIAEPILDYSGRLKQAETALFGSLKALNEQDLKVIDLEAQLKEALESSLSSAEKIATLEQSLKEAKLQVAALKRTVKESEKELSRLLALSETLEKTIKDNEKNHLADLERVRKAHLAETFKIRIGGWMKFGIGVAAGTGIAYLIFRLIR